MTSNNSITIIIVAVLIIVAIMVWNSSQNNSKSQSQSQKGGGVEAGAAEASVEAKVVPEVEAEAEEVAAVNVPLDGLDSTRNMQVVFPSKIMNYDGFLTEWRFNAGRQGIVNLQIYRPTKESDVFTLVGENIYQVVKLGENIYKVPPMRQIPFRKGDVVGLRFPDLGIIKYVTSANDVRIALGDSTGPGQPMKFGKQSAREYSVVVISRSIPRVNRKAIGGTKSHPALSAQSIISEYSKSKLGYPVDGTYWIKSKVMKEPIEIYCNFSMRKGTGYMLVGSVSGNSSWLPMGNNNFPFSPQMSYGKYDKYGRNGNYYLQWDELDPSTVVDSDPNRCQYGKFVYNQSGKFCANAKDPNSRIKLPGGLTQIVFATANGKHWVALDRTDLEKPVSAGRKAKLTPIATSGNFEEPATKNNKKNVCKPNKNVYLVGSQSETWVSMGSEEGCSNYVFWGSAGSKKNLDFKTQNQGIMIYVGGEHQIPRKKRYRHNPSHHYAPGKGRYKSTYRDAKAVCSSMGKRVCSWKQLKESNDDGYSKCAAGWTSTKANKYKYKIGFATDVAQWASLQANPKQADWCGKPGMNEWASLRPDQTGADIYCCDNFEWSDDFDKLNMPYRLAKEWIGKLEEQFYQSYAAELPINVRFIVFGGQGHGLACKKLSDTEYGLIEHKDAVAHKEHPKIVSQIPPGKFSLDPRTVAIFLDDLKAQNIDKNEQWPKLDSKEKIVRYGSIMKLFNPDTKQYLSGSEIPYQSIAGKGSGNRQVVGEPKPSNGSAWIIKTLRGAGKIDANGLGDDTYRFGKPIKNGKTIRLENRYSNRNLHCDVNYHAPGLSTAMKEVSLFKVGPEGDSNDYWRVETINGSKYWYVNQPVRFVHVNTGRVLTVPGTTHQTKPSGGSTVNTIAVDPSRGGNDKWQVVDVVVKIVPASKCLSYISTISRNKRLLETGAKGYGDLASKNKELQRKYNNECFYMSKHSHDKVLAPELSKVASQTKIMNSEQEIFDKYVKQKEIENKRLLDKETHRKSRKSRLDELLAIRCKPVKVCVDAVGNNVSINEKCKGLVPLTKGKKVTDSLIKEIKSIRRGSDNINNYDIRSHRDYFKYSKAGEVSSC